MSIIFRIAGLILGVLMIVYGIDMGNQSAKIYDDISLILILTGIFQCSFSLIVASIYDEVKKVKTDSLNSLSYIEELLVYTKNQVKEISEKISKKEEE